MFLSVICKHIWWMVKLLLLNVNKIVIFLRIHIVLIFAACQAVKEKIRKIIKKEFAQEISAKVGAIFLVQLLSSLSMGHLPVTSHGN